jgi:hypothetical protein
MYTFSYTARTLGGTTSVDAKVAQAIQPYGRDYESPSDNVGTTPTTFSHPFMEMVAGGDPAAGLAFWINTSTSITVCFSNVSMLGG